jgi:sirohydrochlorin ferrochelatase
MSHPALLAVAHGSRNPAAADVIRKLAKQVGRLAPMLDVRVAFLGHAQPSLPEELSAAGSGAVVVPLLLSSGYHVSTDIADAANSAGARVAAPLGPDQLLLTALTARLTEAGVPDDTPVVLATDVEKQAVLLAAQLNVPVLAAYLSAARPTVAEAVARLREQTGKPVAVASYLLAPGHFSDRLADCGADWVSDPLGGHPALAGVIIDRYRAAAKAR